jgi:hypothetical protein
MHLREGPKERPEQIEIFSAAPPYSDRQGVQEPGTRIAIVDEDVRRNPELKKLRYKLSAQQRVSIVHARLFGG